MASATLDDLRKHPAGGAIASCRSLLVSIVLFSLCGCGALQAPATAGRAEDAPKSDLRIARVLANEGLEKLRQYRYEDASRIFNAGLKFSPDNAQLHFLNGLTYHLLYLRGDEAKRELAVTGYELALNYDPAHYRAALQLGRLEFEAKRYARSVEAFRHSIDIEPHRGDGHHGLAAAAYFARDLTSARASIEKAVALLPREAEASRAAAMIYAASGDQPKAREAAARHALLEHDAGARARLGERIDQWASWHAAMPAVQPARKQADTVLAQLGPPPPSSPASGSSGGGPTTPSGAPVRPWFDCGGGGANAPQPTYGGVSGGIDDTVVLPSLPGPCQGASNPRMVVLDIAFIRTENNASSTHGINLLEGLTYVFDRTRVLQDVLTRRTEYADSRDVTITQTRSRGLPANGIAYSLNIANATDSRTEMLARPSLVALDRMPSTFFAGSNVTLGIQGQGGGSSYVTDRPVGVSLSVTPTFGDGDTVLLAVRAARSFVEEVDQSVQFGHTLQTSRNAVSANVVLKLGQTLILSGLSEQEIQRNSDGVPVLKDIPVLQYLFGTKVAQNFTRSVLVLITPRMPAFDRELMASTVPHIDTLSSDKSVYRPLIESTMKATPDSAPGNLEGTYRHAYGNKLFLQFRSGDLAIQHWSEPSRLGDFFRDMKELLYF